MSSAKFTTPSKPQSQKYTHLGDAKSSNQPLSVSLSLSPSQSRPLSHSQHLNEDIDGFLWLEEIDMEQYAETFLTNLSQDGRILLRSRLATVRQQDLAKMNITNFHDQKEIMQHIHLVLKFPFNSPIRKKEVTLMSPEKAKRRVNKALDAQMRAAGSKDSNDHNKQQSKQGGGLASRVASMDPNDAKSDRKLESNKSGNQKKDTMSVKEQLEDRKKQARRRRSFDEAVWNKINNMRTKQQEVAAAADILREGLGDSGAKESLPLSLLENEVKPPISAAASKGGHRRRWSYGEDLSTAHDKSMAYGNLALQYDMIQAKLRSLQHEYLAQFKQAVRCEKASIFFVNEVTKDLILLAEDDQRWYRIAAGSSLAGACAEKGECVNVADAYDDHRFNRNMDIRTGFRTKSVLCQPVRRSRGAGSVVAVIEMMNKIGGEPFDAEDENTIAAASQHVAEALGERFKELETCAETFSAIATYLGGKNNSALLPSAPGYTEHTTSTSSKVRWGGAVEES